MPARYERPPEKAGEWLHYKDPEETVPSQQEEALKQTRLEEAAVVPAQEQEKLLKQSRQSLCSFKSRLLHKKSPKSERVRHELMA